MRAELDHAYLSEIAQLEETIVIVAEEYPEIAGLFMTLLGTDELERMQEDEAERRRARELRAQMTGTTTE